MSTICVADRGRPLKSVVVRGAFNNLVFAGGGSILLYLQAIVVMRAAGPDRIGLFAIAAAVALTTESISDFGIGDHLVQEDGTRLQETYNCAVVLHLLMAGALWLLLWSMAPSAARVYGQPELRSLVRGMSYTAFAGFLRLPLFLFYRDLRYVRQRLLIFLGRVAGFVVTLACVWRGLGIWSFVYGGFATLLVTGGPAWIMAPLGFTWRFPWSSVGSTLKFSSPVWLSKVTYVLVQQGGVLVLSLFFPLVVVGQFKSSEQISSIVFYVEVVLGQTLYPALCRMRSSPDDIAAMFSKAARVSMTWIAGCAIGLLVFAGDIVSVVLSEQWAGTQLFLCAQGAALLFGALIYNWEVLFKTVDNTRPIFLMSIVFAVLFGVFFVPPMYFGGRRGAALGLVLVNATVLVSRTICIRQLKLRISLVQIAWRAIAAASAAGAVAMALGAAFADGRTAGALAVRVLVYLSLYLGGLAWLERDLLSDMIETFRLKPTRPVYDAPMVTSVP